MIYYSVSIEFFAIRKILPTFFAFSSPAFVVVVVVVVIVVVIVDVVVVVFLAHFFAPLFFHI